MPMFEFLVALPIGAVIGWIIREIVSDRLARDRALELYRITEFNKAAAEFKSAFIPELRYLDYRYSPNRMDAPGIYKTLSLAFDRHEVAVIKFRPHLKCQQRIDFDKAWDDYCNKKDDSKPHFIVYAEPDGVTDRIKAQKFYLEKLNALLKFAEPKH